MSTEKNQEWLELAKQNFDQAIFDEEWEYAEAVIADVIEAGFSSEGEYLQLELKRAKREMDY